MKWSIVEVSGIDDGWITLSNGTQFGHGIAPTARVGDVYAVPDKEFANGVYLSSNPPKCFICGKTAKDAVCTGTADAKKFACHACLYDIEDK